MQRAELRDDKEQKEHAEPARVQKVLSPLPLPHDAPREQIGFDFRFWILDFGLGGLKAVFESDQQSEIQNRQTKIRNRHRGMVSMVSMEVSKTLGPGSNPGTPASNTSAR